MNIEVGKEYNLDPRELKFIVGNRVIDNNHLNKLKLALQEENLLHEDPIIINKAREIIDGQHRVCAALSLGFKEVPCRVRAGGLELAQKLNKHTRNWSLNDFAFSFAKQGNRHYQVFCDYRQRWGFGLNECVDILSGKVHENYHNFRAGQFKVKTTEQEAKKIAEHIEDFKNLVPKNGYKNRAFVMAFLKIYRLKGYSHKRLLHKLELQPLRRCPDHHMYLEELERIYNFQARTGDRLHFSD